MARDTALPALLLALSAAALLACDASGGNDKRSGGGGDAVDLAPCPTHGPPCDCQARWAARAFERLGEAQLARRIHALCQDGDGLRVTSYVPSTDPDPFAPPAELYDTRLDGALVELSEELVVDGVLSDPDLCQRPSAPAVTASAGAYTATARVVETADGWYEALLDVTGPEGAATWSFNRHLNAVEPFPDTFFLYDDHFDVAGRVRASGAATFYFHAFHDAHVDILRVADLPGALAGGADEPTHARLELTDDPATTLQGSYEYRSLLVRADPDGADADRLVVFTTVAPVIRGYTVRATGTPEPLEALELDSFWSQAGWQHLGGAGPARLVQSEVGSFSNSVLRELDVDAWAWTARWELGCIGAPPASGSRLLADGRLLRFGWSHSFADDAVVMILDRGGVHAISPLAYDHLDPTYLLDEATGRLYVADRASGAITGLALPTP